MATSGSGDFTATRDEIIKDALANVGARGPNGTPSGNQYAHAARILNDLVKSIDAEGNFLWRVTRQSITTVASQANYSISANYIDVDNVMRFTESGSSDASTITRISRDEYMRIPNRTEEARAPVQFYAERDLTSDGRVQTTIYFWPEPSTSGDSIEYAAFTRGEDFDSGSNNLDFPQAWIHCLKLGLSAALAPAYGQRSLGNDFQQKYLVELSKQTNADNERGDLWFVPYGHYSNGFDY